MSIYITGDIHGPLSAKRLRSKGPLPKGLTRDDYVIICGDFGLVWYPEDDMRHKEDKWWLDWLEEKPFTVLFVDGNHENHDMLGDMIVDEWHGGKVHRIRKNVYHLMRGQVFNLDGKTFFTMGGAYSHDIEYRIEGISWWRSEVPNRDEREEAISTLDAHGWYVDYVLTHCGPSSALPPCRISDPIMPDEYTDWLEREVSAKLDFKQWFFGHYHRTQQMTDRHWCLYGDFYDLESGRLLGQEVEPGVSEQLGGGTVEPPKFKRGDEVAFCAVSCNVDARRLRRVRGVIKIVDVGGAIGVNEHSYDIFSESENMLYKHVPESSVAGLAGRDAR